MEYQLQHHEAVQAVFRLPEILENVLMNLPSKDLLLCQRVSRSFRYTVQGSVRLRRMLFLEPDWKLEGRFFDAYANHNRPGRKPENNMLLLSAFPSSLPTVRMVVQPDEQFVHRSQAFEQRPAPRKNIWSWNVGISFPSEGQPQSKPAVAYPEASWRKMYLSQPPCTSLHLTRRWHRSRNPAMIRANGITMGDLVDETVECSGLDTSNHKWHRSYISSDRDWHFEGSLKCTSVAS